MFSSLAYAASALVLAATVRAQASSNCAGVAATALPSCALPCFISGAPSVGCSATDYSCLCNKEAALFAAVEGCVATGCPSASFQAVIDGASSVCSCATGMGGGLQTVSGSVISGSMASNTVGTVGTVITAGSTATVGTAASSGMAGTTGTGNPAPTATASMTAGSSSMATVTANYAARLADSGSEGLVWWILGATGALIGFF